MRKKLIIISHTEHYKVNRVVFGWGPTINEINELAGHWNEVVHIACLHKGSKPASAEPYKHSNISFVSIPPFGGNSVLKKLAILVKAPGILITILRSIKGASEVQIRLPMALGIFLLPLFSFGIRRRFNLWIKYAGDWSAKNAPFSYRFQRGWLNNNLTHCKVTINGVWPHQPAHCYSFENPCLNHEEIILGQHCSDSKEFSPPFTFTFVGRIEKAKGIDKVIEAVNSLPDELIRKIHFIGDGREAESFLTLLKVPKEKIIFNGFQPRSKVHEILSLSHFLLLPSESEGFPKVVAEAACYGCIPVVSAVGSIGHYIHDSNGYVWDKNAPSGYSTLLLKAVSDSVDLLKAKSQEVTKMAKYFTHEHYFTSLKKYILD